MTIKECQKAKARSQNTNYFYTVAMICFALLLCIGVATVRADLAGVAVVAGDCLCVNGTEVSARDRPGTANTNVIAVYNTGSCFKLVGGNQTVGRTRWYEVTERSRHLWIAGNYLTKSDARACSAATCSPQERDLACQLIRNPSIQAAQSHLSGHPDNANAYDNLVDMCQGKKASRSSFTCTACSTGAPGGTTCLGTRLLEYLLELGKHFTSVYIMELAGGCHNCQSRHYNGTTVDLRTPTTTAQHQGYIDTCNKLGGMGKDEANHVHCQF